MRRAGLALVLLAGACAISGCAAAADAGAGDAGAAGSPVPVATPSGAVDCGTVTVGQAQAPPAAMVDCFVTAAGRGAPARLSITRPTTEGDPIPTVYVVRADGRIDVVTDGRQDAFGTREVTRELCTGVTVGADGFLSLASCAPA